MKLEEALPKMSKLYLHRTLDSFLKDVRKPDEDASRELILTNLDALIDEERIRTKLDFAAEIHDVRVLNRLLVERLLNSEDYCQTEQDLLADIQRTEQEVVESAQDDRALAYSDQQFVSIYSDVLEAAWRKDGDLNTHEEFIIQTLADRIGISSREHQIISARLKRWPAPGNRLHSDREVEEALKNLQTRGLLMRLRDGHDTFYVIPDELAVPLRRVLAIELRGDSFKLMLGRLQNGQLQAVLKKVGLQSSGSKSDLINRICDAHISPTRVLSILPNEELYELLKRLPGVAVSGSKDDRTQRILDHFDSIIVRQDDAHDENGSRAYAYIEELARRDYKQLRGNSVITKDLEVERLFETATKHLFESHLGYSVEIMDGSDHADGKVNLPNGELLLWDNKSCESSYPFNEQAFDQFRRYIAAEQPKRVSIFLVIAPSFSSGAEAQAHRLKMESGSDADVGLITAGELKWLAENWQTYRKREDQPLNLAVLDYTGRLTIEQLRSRLGWAM